MQQTSHVVRMEDVFIGLDGGKGDDMEKAVRVEIELFC
jgi:hypothetical protein